MHIEETHMLELRPAAARGLANLGWLQSHHTFSFGSYYDPEHTGFSDLLVINDDRVRPGRGFDTHGHRDVQMMSAGTGIRHSEFNASRQEPVHFLQIWIVPDREGVTPRYQQQHFTDADKRGRLRLIISPEGAEGSLSVYQDVRVYAGLFDGAEKQRFVLPEDRFGYLHVARGALRVNGERLSEGDGARLRGVQELDFSDGDNAEVLMFDLRPQDSHAH
jgi:redox-sensitive bicupin YhaK (pirin superfamily)